ncbi:hypothetical protein PF005_g1782 [Phytophthora fragariae]|nr:hypothetical protein PF003_g15493 [Phytophthora fragariae]KAE8948592.1 hypothetical protein PF009_g1827 [Phytophthora fragariae]KAE9029015.1 hypothetical protein PF011_g1281 [Phytophthora fragariae]KAE9137069.1 hypothetical protein PF010_g1461 [Phytophthora fragariae]KAE9137191.1 hypothetical protein PF007_g1892 [Phytophthora fragariae]
MKLLHHLLASAVCVAVLVAISPAPATGLVVKETYAAPITDEGVSKLLRSPDESEDDSSETTLELEGNDDDDSTDYALVTEENSPNQTRHLKTSKTSKPAKTSKPSTPKPAATPKPTTTSKPPAPSKTIVTKRANLGLFVG